MELAFATDARFAARTAVAVHSILANTPRRASITVVADDMPDLIAHSLACMCREHGSNLRVVPFERSRVSDLPIFQARMSAAAYFRLFLPEILPADCDKVLYLDSDIVCRGDIAPLWDADLGHAALGAVRDFAGARFGEIVFSPDFRRRTESAARFNSGVLLINLQKWRAMKVGEAALAWRRANPGLRQSHDQAALNAVLAQDWRQLSARWNFGTWFLFYTRYAAARHRRRLDPIVIHYSRHLGRLPYDALFDRHYRACERRFGWPSSYRPGREPGSARSYLTGCVRALHRHLWPWAYGRALEFGEGRAALGGPDAPVARSAPATPRAILANSGGRVT